MPGTSRLSSASFQVPSLQITSTTHQHKCAQDTDESTVDRWSARTTSSTSGIWRGILEGIRRVAAWANFFTYWCPSDNNEATSKSPSFSFLCQTCGSVVFENQNMDEGYLVGTLYLGPDLKTTSSTSAIDESMHDVYPEILEGSRVDSILTIATVTNDSVMSVLVTEWSTLHLSLCAIPSDAGPSGR